MFFYRNCIKEQIYYSILLYFLYATLTECYLDGFKHATVEIYLKVNLKVEEKKKQIAFNFHLN